MNSLRVVQLTLSSLCFAVTLPLVHGTESLGRETSTTAAATIVVSEGDVALIFEDCTGRPPSEREIRKYHDLAYQQRWNREQFRQEFRRSDECRALTPDRAVQNAFRELLRREPTSGEYRIFVRRMELEDWTPGQVRQAIRDSEEYREIEINRTIEHAFQELLGHRPSHEQRNHYRDRMLRRGLDEDGLYREIRESREYRIDIPNEKITLAWKNILGREPDVRGLDRYRETVYKRNLSIEDIERDLRKSPEFAERCDQLINETYHDLMGRDADPKSQEVYRRRMIDKGWTIAQVREDLKKMPEYRARHR